MDYSGKWALRARGIGQKLGILRPAVRAFRKLTRQSYEEAFDRALMSAIRPGDTVWDVGANVGVYTTRFADAVGETGRVVAFEPSPASIEALRSACSGRGNIEIVNAALSDQAGTVDFYVSREGHSVTDGFSPKSPSDVKVEVQAAPGDDWLRLGQPAVIKIDVEGFELEVIRGMHAILRSPGLRGLFVEVHFLASVERGEPQGPAKLTALLKEAGLSYHWVDASHLVATRAGR